MQQFENEWSINIALTLASMKTSSKCLLHAGFSMVRFPISSLQGAITTVWIIDSEVQIRVLISATNT